MVDRFGTGDTPTVGEARLAKKIDSLIRAAIEERVGRAIDARGRINAQAIGGIVPARNGGTATNTGIRDHNHDGTNTQQLDAENTHENVILGDDPGAIHWTEAALIALIEANIPPTATALAELTDVVLSDLQNGHRLVYRTSDGKWHNEPAYRLVPVTNGEIDYPEIVFDDGDIVTEPELIP